MTDGVEFSFITEEEIEKARQKELDKMGLTWAEVKTLVKDCGCCIREPPEEYSHLSREYIRRFWMLYHHGYGME